MCSLTFSEFRASCVGRCAWWNRGRAWSLPVSRCESVSGDWGMGRERLRPAYCTKKCARLRIATRCSLSFRIPI